MEEKNVTKISLSTFLLLIAVIIIAVMGYFIYKLNNDKTTAVQKSTELQTQVNSLSGTMNDLQGKINSIYNTINNNYETNANSNQNNTNSNSNSSSVTEDQDKSKKSENVLKDGTYETESFVDPSDGSGIHQIKIENNKFTIELSYDGSYNGTYTISDNILICNANEEIINEGGYSKNTTNAIFEFKIINNSKLEFITSKNISSEYNVNKGFIFSKK